MSPGSLTEGGGGFSIPSCTRARLHALYASLEYCPFLCGSCAPSGRAVPDARTHVLWFGQYLQVIWQIITKHQSGWLALILFQVSEITAILGVPDPARY